MPVAKDFWAGAVQIGNFVEGARQKEIELSNATRQVEMAEAVSRQTMGMQRLQTLTPMFMNPAVLKEWDERPWEGEAAKKAWAEGAIMAGTPGVSHPVFDRNTYILGKLSQKIDELSVLPEGPIREAALDHSLAGIIAESGITAFNKFESFIINSLQTGALASGAIQQQAAGVQPQQQQTDQPKSGQPQAGTPDPAAQATPLVLGGAQPAAGTQPPQQQPADDAGAVIAEQSMQASQHAVMGAAPPMSVRSYMLGLMKSKSPSSTSPQITQRVLSGSGTYSDWAAYLGSTSNKMPDGSDAPVMPMYTNTGVKMVPNPILIAPYDPNSVNVFNSIMASNERVANEASKAIKSAEDALENYRKDPNFTPGDSTHNMLRNRVIDLWNQHSDIFGFKKISNEDRTLILNSPLFNEEFSNYQGKIFLGVLESIRAQYATEMGAAVSMGQIAAGATEAAGRLNAAMLSGGAGGNPIEFSAADLSNAASLFGEALPSEFITLRNGQAVLDPASVALVTMAMSAADSSGDADIRALVRKTQQNVFAGGGESKMNQIIALTPDIEKNPNAAGIIRDAVMIFHAENAKPGSSVTMADALKLSKDNFEKTKQHITKYVPMPPGAAFIGGTYATRFTNSSLERYYDEYYKVLAANPHVLDVYRIAFATGRRLNDLLSGRPVDIPGLDWIGRGGNQGAAQQSYTPQQSAPLGTMPIAPNGQGQYVPVPPAGQAGGSIWSGSAAPAAGRGGSAAPAAGRGAPAQAGAFTGVPAAQVPGIPSGGLPAVNGQGGSDVSPMFNAPSTTVDGTGGSAVINNQRINTAKPEPNRTLFGKDAPAGAGGFNVMYNPRTGSVLNRASTGSGIDGVAFTGRDPVASAQAYTVLSTAGMTPAIYVNDPTFQDKGRAKPILFRQAEFPIASAPGSQYRVYHPSKKLFDNPPAEGIKVSRDAALAITKMSDSQLASFMYITASQSMPGSVLPKNQFTEAVMPFVKDLKESLRSARDMRIPAASGTQPQTTRSNGRFRVSNKNGWYAVEKDGKELTYTRTRDGSDKALYLYKKRNGSWPDGYANLRTMRDGSYGIYSHESITDTRWNPEAANRVTKPVVTEQKPKPKPDTQVGSGAAEGDAYINLDNTIAYKLFTGDDSDIKLVSSPLIKDGQLATVNGAPLGITNRLFIGRSGGKYRAFEEVPNSKIRMVRVSPLFSQTSDTPGGLYKKVMSILLPDDIRSGVKVEYIGDNIYAANIDGKYRAYMKSAHGYIRYEGNVVGDSVEDLRKRLRIR